MIDWENLICQCERCKQREKVNILDELAKKYSDVYAVINERSLSAFDFFFPILSNRLGKIPQSLDKWEIVYILLKDFLVNQELTEDVNDAEIYIKAKKIKERMMKKQSAKDKLDEKLGMKDGKESSKKQSMKDRRDESKGMKKGKC
jgi:hypothetical protein